MVLNTNLGRNVEFVQNMNTLLRIVSFVPLFVVVYTKCNSASVFNENGFTNASSWCEGRACGFQIHDIESLLCTCDSANFTDTVEGNNFYINTMYMSEFQGTAGLLSLLECAALTFLSRMAVSRAQKSNRKERYFKYAEIGSYMGLSAHIVAAALEEAQIMPFKAFAHDMFGLDSETGESIRNI